MKWTVLRMAGALCVSGLIACGSHTDEGTKKSPDKSAGESGKDGEEGGKGGKEATAEASGAPGKDEGSAGKPAEGGTAGSKPSTPTSTPMSSGGAGKAPASMPMAMTTPPASGAAGSADKCDLNASFALHAKLQVTVSPTAGVEEAKDVSDVWGLVNITQAADGKLSLTLGACGTTTPDLCGTGLPPLIAGAESYGQYVPLEHWEKPSTPSAAVEWSPEKLMPGASFETPPIAELLGIALKDPTGPFPATRKDVQDSAEFDGSAVNEAKWVDIDGDEKPGLTMYLVPPGGIAAGGATGPLEEKTATSAKCPRNDAGAKRSPYAYLPLPEGLMIRRVKRMYAGQRLIMELRGKLDSCDRVSGEVTGPKGGKLELENKVGGCVTASGSDEAPCPASVVDLFDSMSGAKLSVQSGTFSMVRIDAAASCADVRAAKFE